MIKNAISRELGDGIKKILGVETGTVIINDPIKGLPKPARFSFCPRRNSRKSKSVLHQCHILVCSENKKMCPSFLNSSFFIILHVLSEAIDHCDLCINITMKHCISF